MQNPVIPTLPRLAEWMAAWHQEEKYFPRFQFIQKNAPPPTGQCSFVKYPRLMLCLKGKRAYRSENKITQIQTGQGLYFAPGTWIAATPVQHFQSLGIHWEKHQLRIVLREEGYLDSPLAVWNFPFESFFPDWPEMLANALNTGTGSCLAEGILLTELGHVIARLCSNTGQSPSRRHQLYLRICAYLEEQYERPHTRESVAAQFQISTGHLTRLFREEGGCGFQQTLEKLRIREAKRLLRTGEFQIQDIALRCGFQDAGYFSRVFRKHHGTSPKTFYEYK